MTINELMLSLDTQVSNTVDKVELRTEMLHLNNSDQISNIKGSNARKILLEQIPNYFSNFSECHYDMTIDKYGDNRIDVGIYATLV